MKHALFTLVIAIAAITAKAQTTPPTMVEMVKLYKGGDTVALNNYGKLLGYGYPTVGLTDIGNTYTYNHFIFTTKDTSHIKDYLIYTFGDHYPMFSNSLVSIEFGTNNQIIFDGLIDELKGLGAIGEVLKTANPGWIFYKYNGAYISTHINNVGNGHKYTISFGGGGW